MSREIARVSERRHKPLRTWALRAELALLSPGMRRHRGPRQARRVSGTGGGS
jgi:hypothetical protein